MTWEDSLAIEKRLHRHHPLYDPPGVKLLGVSLILAGVPASSVVAGVRGRRVASSGPEQPQAASRVRQDIMGVLT